MGNAYGYVRVFTQEQNEARQLDAMTGRAGSDGGVVVLTKT